ncbi:D-alanyl-D-alanine carboxypeptidase/D-alanyl-D-alanine endopeptidase [Nakamurella leprariae]|uniref:D-alanyl-D-alanine carboxypeptidase/D-alanyl-D-alanine-endopeptidase n=1 Tax=Nakamurella leprariae TaxID=2803911 RepID=A0A939C0M9_9ACTN|nr:D-alanyl-D-alanine carboxypeptidase/D-alanyl-D-alanine-endopeptidase [Nakamurella leprariae]MBM9466317.1 D-alanyl-D-alanine carboxypeptidase/D-alanyl-D-alanine-endopeptidase [Nakamurella leprariae]
MGTRRVLIIATAVVIVLVVAGVLIATALRPDSSQDAAPSPTSTPTDPPVAVAPSRVAPITGSDQVPTAAGVQARLAGPLANPALGQLSGIIVDPASGATLWSEDAATPQIPASTVKLLTGAALLTSADPDARLVTQVVAGDQEGDIVLIGGGDVTLSARAEGVETEYAGAPTMADLAAQVLASGVDVRRIVLDATAWIGPDFAEGWLTADIGTDTTTGSITRMSPLMVDGDRINPGTQYSRRTGDPTITAGKAFAAALGQPDLPLIEGPAPEGAQVIGEVSSQPLSILLAQALEQSDNVLAEALARQVALARGAEPSFEGAAQATIEAIQAMGIDTIGTELFDGSGLSESDRVPPTVLAAVLSQAVGPDAGTLRDLLTGLPVAGATGTLDERYRESVSHDAAGWLRAKTGSVAVTYGLAGYVPDQNGRLLVFALNSNSVVGNPTRYAMDAVAAALRGCGCS